ncbi:MAG: hypothetical protein WAM30_19085 [Candidatus Dormiibacterota bacterium]
MTRYGRVALLVGTPLVMLAVIGAVYFQIYTGSHATRGAWMLTQRVAAGTLLTSDNVQRVTIPDSGAAFEVLSQDPISAHRRAGHSMQASHLLAPDDLMDTGEELVPISFAASPGLQPGDRVDVYVVAGGGTIQVGRGLIVASTHSIWVPAGDARYWVALQGANAELLAVQSSGAGNAASDQIGLEQAIAALNQTAGGSGRVGGSSPAPSPAPSGRTASPAPSGQPSPHHS